MYTNQQLNSKCRVVDENKHITEDSTGMPKRVAGVKHHTVSYDCNLRSDLFMYVDINQYTCSR
jgi:hypothetical protein